MILDTNALSAMADGTEELEEVLRQASEIALPVIVLGEYRFGIRQSRHAARYERWLADMIEACRVLEVNDDTAQEYAAVRGDLKRLGRPIPGNDVWIAALARQHAMPVVSRDAHFDSVLELIRLSW